MKNKLSPAERLSDALGNIDDRLLEKAYDIDSADKLKKASRKALYSPERIRKLATVAACVILLAGAVSVIPYLRHINDKHLPPDTGDGAISSPLSPPVSSSPGPDVSVSTPVTPPESPVSTPPALDETQAGTQANTPAETQMQTPAETPLASYEESPVGTPEVSYQETPDETPQVSEAESAASSTTADPSAGNEPDVTIPTEFSSRSELAEFVKAASSSPEVYEDYLSSSDLPDLPSFDVASDIARNILSAEVLISLRDSADGVTEARYSYDVTSDSLTLTVTAGGVRFEFIHSFTIADGGDPSGELVMGGVPIGDRFIDLFRGDGDLIGTLTAGGVTVTVRVCTVNAESHVLSAFDTLSGDELAGEAES